MRASHPRQDQSKTMTESCLCLPTSFFGKLLDACGVLVQMIARSRVRSSMQQVILRRAQEPFSLMSDFLAFIVSGTFCHLLLACVRLARTAIANYAVNRRRPAASSRNERAEAGHAVRDVGSKLWVMSECEQSPSWSALAINNEAARKRLSPGCLFVNPLLPPDAEIHRRQCVAEP